MSSGQVFSATTKLQDSPCEAVVVHCSDHRFQQGFREFLVEGLGLGSYALLTVPGGGHFCSMQQLQPKFARAGLQSLKFLVKRTGARRITLIGHDDCLFFKDQLQFFFSEPDLNQKQITNLKRARRVVQESFTRATVELFFAYAGRDGSLQFRNVG